jgi:hypothetical protein
MLLMRLLFVQLALKESGCSCSGCCSWRSLTREYGCFREADTREGDTRADAARAATWSLVRLLLVQLRNMPLLNAAAAVLFVQLSLLV